MIDFMEAKHRKNVDKNKETLYGLKDWLENKRAETGKELIDFDFKLANRIKHMVNDDIAQIDVKYINGFGDTLVFGVRVNKMIDTRFLMIGGYGNNVYTYNLDMPYFIFKNEETKYEYDIIFDEERKCEFIVKEILKDSLPKLDVTEILLIKEKTECF